MVMGAPRSEIKDVHGDERGFTLQEVLTVIVILGILVAIAVIVFLALLERWRVNAATNQLVADLRLAHASATNQLTDWRVVLVPDQAETEYGPDYYLVKLADPYEQEDPAPPTVAGETPPEPRYFPGDVGILNIRGALDTERGWAVEPSIPGRTRTLEFNSDGAMVFYQGVSGSTCVTVDRNPENRVVVHSATSRVKVKPDSC
jgi:prepilin-type N-terminal cleavage/methylation domain-containing protein